MEEMSVSEKAAYNIQTREEFEVIKKRLDSLVKNHFKEHSIVGCEFWGFSEYMKSAEIIIEFYYNDLRGDKLEDLFFYMRKMDLTINCWFIGWDKKTIDIRFSW